jgi:hypothetical protein
MCVRYYPNLWSPVFTTATCSFLFDINNALKLWEIYIYFGSAGQKHSAVIESLLHPLKMQSQHLIGRPLILDFY